MPLNLESGRSRPHENASMASTSPSAFSSGTQWFARSMVRKVTSSATSRIMPSVKEAKALAAPASASTGIVSFPSRPSSAVSASATCQRPRTGEADGTGCVAPVRAQGRARPSGANDQVRDRHQGADQQGFGPDREACRPGGRCFGLVVVPERIIVRRHPTVSLDRPRNGCSVRTRTMPAG